MQSGIVIVEALIVLTIYVGSVTYLLLNETWKKQEREAFLEKHKPIDHLPGPKDW